MFEPHRPQADGLTGSRITVIAFRPNAVVLVYTIPVGKFDFIKFM